MVLHCTGKDDEASGSLSDSSFYSAHSDGASPPTVPNALEQNPTLPVPPTLALPREIESTTLPMRQTRSSPLGTDTTNLVQSVSPPHHFSNKPRWGLFARQDSPPGTPPKSSPTRLAGQPAGQSVMPKRKDRTPNLRKIAAKRSRPPPISTVTSADAGGAMHAQQSFMDAVASPRDSLMPSSSAVPESMVSASHGGGAETLTDARTAEEGQQSAPIAFPSLEEEQRLLQQRQQSYVEHFRRFQNASIPASPSSEMSGDAPSSKRPPSGPHLRPAVSSGAASKTSADDWGDDFLSNPDGDQSGVGLHSRALSESRMSRLQRKSSSEFTSSSMMKSPRTSKHGWDSLKLHTDETRPSLGGLLAPEIPLNHVIGIYADPTAERDDWAEDFQLDLSSGRAERQITSQANELRRHPSSMRHIAQPMTEVMSLLLQKAKERMPRGSDDDFHSIDGEIDTDQFLGESPSRGADEFALSLHTETFTGGTMSALVDLKFSPDEIQAGPPVSYGFDDGEVHPICARFFEMWGRHLPAIETHLEGLRADKSAMQVLEGAAESVYSFTSDPDISRLGSLPDYDEVAKEILLWKLEHAKLCNDPFLIVRVEIGLGRLDHRSGWLTAAFGWFDKADAELERCHATAEYGKGLEWNFSKHTRDQYDCMIDNLRIELHFEVALARRSLGELETGAATLGRAADLSLALASRDFPAESSYGCEQRGLWWALQCKFMLAETFYEQSRFPEALQLYVEYAVEAIARMIGLVAPSRPDQNTVGSSLMRYCLFLPRRLALSVWASALCLAQMNAVDLAGDMSSMAMRTATALGIEDVRVATVEFCGRINVALRDSKRPQLAGGSFIDPKLGIGFLDNFDVEGGDIMEGDWDTTIAQELNITIQRCSDVTAAYGATLFTPGTVLSAGAAMGQQGNLEASGRDEGCPSPANPSQKMSVSEQTSLHGGFVSPGFGSSHNDLAESELRQYLNRLNAAAANMTSQQMSYPKPTEPFRVAAFGPMEHESFLREFVRCRTQLGADVRSPECDAPSECQFSDTDSQKALDPLRDFRTRLQGLDRFSSEYAAIHVEALWRALRSPGNMFEKRDRAQILVNSVFMEVAERAPRLTVPEGEEKADRLSMVANLLEVLKLAREVLAADGKSASWFSKATNLLLITAASVTQSAKSAVELFRAESRAHCGVTSVTPRKLLLLCEKNHSRQNSDFDGSSNVIDQVPSPELHSSSVLPPVELRQSVVDIMHALYWRTKACVDDSTKPDALERIVHADVASALYLVGAGVSPVNGGSLDILKDEAVLHLDKTSSRLVDDTRRVSGLELVADLRGMWSSLPDSAALVRSRVCLALSHHVRVELHDPAYAERLLFDGLLGLHAISLPDSPRVPLYGAISKFSPVAVVSSPLSSALLYEYGSVTLYRSKYRYGIAALEAAVDARKVRDPDNLANMAFSREIVSIALSKYDWRRALTWLYDLRDDAHPKNGMRNEFVHLCVILHQICVDAGCFDAALVPLRAYSALIFEEHLRSLLHRYRTRLEKKSRSRKRYKMATSALPAILTNSSRIGRQRSAVSPSSHVAPVGSHRSRSFTRSEPAPVPIQPPPNDTFTSRNRNKHWVHRASRYLSKLTMRTVNTSETVQNSHISMHEQEQQSKFRVRTVEDSSVVGDADFAFQDAQGAEIDISRLSDAGGTSFVTDESDMLRNHDDDEREELFKIAEEQASVADAERFEVELMKARLSFDRGAYVEADEMCRGLLEMELPNYGSRYFVLEMMAQVRLKRREITRCLEIVEQMEREAALGYSMKTSRDRMACNSQHLNSSHSLSSPRVQGISFRSAESSSSESATTTPYFFPEVIFLRLSALFHGGRLNEALSHADEALLTCPEHQLWQIAKLHYMRGKVLFAMCSSATAPFDSEEVTTAPSAPVDAAIDYQFVELTLSAFEIASGFFEAAGDEVGMVKSDLRWAQTAIDVLFRRIVVRREIGPQIPLHEACRLHDRDIAFGEVEDVIHSALSFLSAANHPLLLIDAIAALAEVKCIQGENSARSFWAVEAWKLFSRLLTDPEEYRIVISPVAPVSTLMRLKDLCGRLVRLVLCSSQAADVDSINRHLCIFEAYVTLQIDIDRRMNLASGIHTAGTSTQGFAKCSSQSEEAAEQVIPIEQIQKQGSAIGEYASPSPGSTSQSHRDPPRHKPAGAFLQVLSDEGIALGRHGFTVFVNRPRQHVMTVVKETGAVLIPTSFLHSSKKRSHEDASRQKYLDTDYIFPFSEKVGLGAMYILEEARFQEPIVNVSQSATPVVSRSDIQHDVSDDAKAAINHGKAGGGFENTRDIKSHAAINTVNNTTSFSGRKRAADEIEARRAMEDCSTRSQMDSKLQSDRSRSNGNALSSIVEAVRGNHEGGNAESDCLGGTSAQRVWAHMHRIKTEVRRYGRGELSIEELGSRNGATVRSWLKCIPVSSREWTVPDVLAKRLVYILYAHGVIGYYSVDRGGCVAILEFGGKQSHASVRVPDAASKHTGSKDASATSTKDLDSKRNNLGSSRQALARKRQSPRPPNDAERKYLYGLVNDWKVKSAAWYKDRESDIVSGLANHVFHAPRRLIEASSSVQKVHKSRPVVLIADLALQVIPWELFLDHVVIRSLSLVDSIRGLQHDISQKHSQQALQDAKLSPTVALSRKIVRFITFSSARKEGGDLEQSEETRRQQLAFQSLLRLNHLSPPRLIARLELGGFSDPTALNAVARPTGPLSTPLTQSKKAMHILGMRVEARFGKKNYSRLDFVKVAGLGSAGTADLKESALVSVQMVPGDKDSIRMELGAYIGVFLFTYADLVDVTESVFGLMHALPRGILIFAPASKMKVVVRHLEDEELDVELQQASGRRAGRIVPDVGASARVIVEYVSRFARSKLIPIVTFVGEGLADIFPQKRSSKRRGLAAPIFDE